MNKKKYEKTKYPNIFKHKENGTWAVDLSLGYDYTGKRIRTTKTGLRTEKEAKEVLRNEEYQKKIKQSIIFDYKFEDLLEEYFEWCKYADKQKEPTIYKKHSTFKNHILPFFQGIKLTKLDDNEKIIEKWHKYLIDKKEIGDDTRNTIHKKLSAYFNWLIKVKKIIRVNPCSLVKNFELPYHEILYYTEKQIKALKNTMKNYNENRKKAYRTLAITDTIYGMGLRLGELQGLCPSDFDFDLLNSTVCNKEIVRVHLNRSIVDDKEIASGKTKGSLDILYIGCNAINSILNYINYCKSIGIIIKKDDFIFKNPNTNFPYAQHTIREDINFFIELAGLPKRKIKDLRKSTASYLLNNGFDLKQAQEQLRHSNYNTTEKHYAQLYEEHKKNRARIINKSL